jgi:hypothetical protein
MVSRSSEDAKAVESERRSKSRSHDRIELLPFPHFDLAINSAFFKRVGLHRPQRNFATS